MEHSVSEVKVNHILSLLIFYVRLSFWAIVPLLHFRFRLLNSPQIYLDHRPEAILLACCNFCSKNISYISNRVEICRDRHDRQSCKICVSCVFFSAKQRDFLHNLRRTSRFTDTKCDFALQLLKIYTLS